MLQALEPPPNETRALTITGKKRAKRRKSTDGGAELRARNEAVHELVLGVVHDREAVERVLRQQIACEMANSKKAESG